jgi:SpoVK/Ycf46/Vps4 family AAA+-type ATPase
LVQDRNTVLQFFLEHPGIPLSLSYKSPPGYRGARCGRSSTGKTVAVKILASELNLLMNWFDLQQVVNKNVGETEKQRKKDI